MTITARNRGIAFSIVAALTLASAWRLLPHLGSSLPSDLGDPILGSWIFWWNANALPLSDAWWSAPMYAPMAGTFAFSEALLAMAPLSTPLQWLGVNPIATHNIVYLLSYPMAGLGAYALAFKITKRHDASLIAALAFAFNPYRIGQLPHIQMQWSCWLPMALAALHDYIETPTSAKAAAGKNRTRALVAFGACWMLNGFTNGYVLVYFPVLVGIWVLWFSRSLKQVAAISAAAVVASLPIAPMLLGYIKWQHFYGFSRTINEIRGFSADLFAIFAVAPRAWLPATWALPPGPEGELYPGAAVFALAIAGAIFAVRYTPVEKRKSIARRILIGLALVSGVLAVIVMLTGGSDLQLGPLSISMHRPSRLLTAAFWLSVFAIATSPLARRAWQSRSPFAFYAIAAAVMYFFALGPEPHAGATQILYKPPYAWLMYLPGFDSVRVPARFGLLMIVCLVQVAAIAFARLTAGGKKVPVYFSAAVVAILLEGWIVMPVVALPAPLETPQRAKDAGAIVLEIPAEGGFEPNTIALYNQMTHGRPIANGFSGYMPPHYYSLIVALEYGDETALDAIRTAGPLAVFVDAARDKKGVNAAAVARASGAELLERTDRGVWYLLPGLSPVVDAAPSGGPLLPASVTATSNPEMIAALTDGKPVTRWHGHVNEPGDAQDDTLTLTFDRPVSAGVVEFDQGVWAAAYARDLEVVGVTDNGDVTLFRGSLAGRVIRAAVDSPEVIVRVPLAPAAPVRSIKLIGHMRGEKWTWSVGEVRIYGK